MGSFENMPLPKQSTATLTAFTRADEHRLHALRKKKAGADAEQSTGTTLTPTVSTPTKKNGNVLKEKCGDNTCGPLPPSEPSFVVDDSTQNITNNVPRKEYFGCKVAPNNNKNQDETNENSTSDDEDSSAAGDEIVNHDKISLSEFLRQGGSQCVGNDLQSGTACKTNILSERSPQKLIEENSLTADEAAELFILEEKYEAFLAEGERSMRKSQIQAASNEGWDGIFTSAAGITETVSNGMSKAARGALFWGSFAATAVPGIMGKKMGVTPTYRHWNWITPQLILGALPVITAVGSSGNHLELIRQQCEERQINIGLVVSCITQDELDGFGIGVLEFAQPQHWREILNVQCFEHVSIEDMTANTDTYYVKVAIDRMHTTIHDKQEAVFVHCKAGKGRSWMVLMSYLCCHGQLEYAEAYELVKSKRYQISPSASQIQFVKDFTAKFRLDAVAKKIMSSRIAESQKCSAQITIEKKDETQIQQVEQTVTTASEQQKKLENEKGEDDETGSRKHDEAQSDEQFDPVANTVVPTKEKESEEECAVPSPSSPIQPLPTEN